MKRFLSTTLKICTIIFIIQVLFNNYNYTYASMAEDVLSAGENFLNDGKQNAINMLEGEEVQQQVSLIYNILFAVGVCLTVIVGALLGIKLMFGSIEEQAKVKETLLPYVIGCVIIFGAFGIWRLVVNIMAGL